MDGSRRSRPPARSAAENGPAAALALLRPRPRTIWPRTIRPRTIRPRTIAKTKPRRLSSVVTRRSARCRETSPLLDSTPV
jgi:hypothetical protein